MKAFAQEREAVASATEGVKESVANAAEAVKETVANAADAMRGSSNALMIGVGVALVVSVVALVVAVCKAGK